MTQLSVDDKSLHQFQCILRSDSTVIAQYASWISVLGFGRVGVVNHQLERQERIGGWRRLGL